ncbi:MAG: hypothetical protein ACREXR_09265, partial [Gammaproteobacteria bacterium]
PVFLVYYINAVRNPSWDLSEQNSKGAVIAFLDFSNTYMFETCAVHRYAARKPSIFNQSFRNATRRLKKVISE